MNCLVAHSLKDRKMICEVYLSWRWFSWALLGRKLRDMLCLSQRLYLGSRLRDTSEIHTISGIVLPLFAHVWELGIRTLLMLSTTLVRKTLAPVKSWIYYSVVFYFDNTRSVTLLYDNNLSSIMSMLTGFCLSTYFWDEYLDNAICIVHEESVLSRRF